MADFYPICLNLRDQPCLVVGGGEIATMKVEPLLRYGAIVTLVAPWVTDTVRQLAEQEKIVWLERRFSHGDIDNKFLIIAATDDQTVNHTVFRLAQSRGRLINVVDDPPRCNFILPAIAESGPVQVTVSTSGRSPTLAGNLRDRIRETFLGPNVATLAEFLGLWRHKLKSELGEFQHKRTFWCAVLDSPIPDLVMSGQVEEAEALLQQHLTSHLRSLAKGSKEQGDLVKAGS